MKHCFLFALLFVVTALSAQNQGKPGGIFDHAIEVTTYSDWGKDYLTITDVHAYFDQQDNTTIYTTLRPIEDEIHQGVVFPWTADVILKVNNVSTKGMTPQQFYNIIDTASTFTLKIQKPARNTIHTQTYAVNKMIDESIAKYHGMKEFLTSYDKSITDTNQRDKNNKNVFDEISDKRFDFSQIKTYDYLIVGNDPLHDTEILDMVSKPFLTRDTIKPDILFCIAKNLDESISSTYIPPTSRTINTGSTTTPVYNYITKNYSYVTNQHNRTIHEGGYTQTTKTGAVYLELSALDAKRINDKSQSTPPIVWQMTANKNYTNYDFNLNEEYLAMASWACIPPVDRWCSEEWDIYEFAGLLPDSINPSLVAEVKAGSRAELAGFKKGDIIKKIEYRYSYKEASGRHCRGDYVVTNKRTIIKENAYFDFRYADKERRKRIHGEPLVEYLNGRTYYNKYFAKEYVMANRATVTILRGKEKLQLSLLPRKKTFSRSYLLHTIEK